jgi:hypothetical protein
MDKTDPESPEKANPGQQEATKRKERALAGLAETVRKLRKNPQGTQEWPNVRAKHERELRAAGLDPKAEFAKAWTS